MNMVARIRELSTPPKDDHDRAVLLLCDQYEALLQQGEPEGWTPKLRDCVQTTPKFKYHDEWKNIPLTVVGMRINDAGTVDVSVHADGEVGEVDGFTADDLEPLSASPLPPAPGADTAEQKQDRFDADADSISSEVNHLPEVQSLPDLCSEDVWPHVERALVAVGRHFRRSKSNG